MVNLELRQFIKTHITRRPKIEAQDVYKLLYQGVYGVGHILSEKAWDHLIEESERINIEEYQEESLTELVSPDGTMIRVNLRPYLRRQMDLEKLYEVMKISADVPRDDGKFISFWHEFKALVREDNLEFSWENIREIDNSLSNEGPKPRHHTHVYRMAYYPAYRVVQKQVFHEYIKTATDN